MIQIELTHEDIDMLREILASHLSELRMEIAHTDNRKLRERLKEREEVMKGVLARIPAGERAA